MSKTKIRRMNKGCDDCIVVSATSLDLLGVDELSKPIAKPITAIIENTTMELTESITEEPSVDPPITECEKEFLNALLVSLGLTKEQQCVIKCQALAAIVAYEVNKSEKSILDPLEDLGECLGLIVKQVLTLVLIAIFALILLVGLLALAFTLGYFFLSTGDTSKGDPMNGSSNVVLGGLMFVLALIALLLIFIATGNYVERVFLDGLDEAKICISAGYNEARDIEQTDAEALDTALCTFSNASGLCEILGCL